jgi:hypothetical protein
VAVGVEGLLAVLLAPGVHQHVGRPGVEALDPAIGMQQRDIGNAAEVEHRTGLPRLREAGGVEGRHQRCALPAGGDVAAAEIAHHVDAGQFGQPCAVEELQRVARAVVQPRLVAHRLTVGTQGRDR